MKTRSLRLPDDLDAAVERQAEKDRRSVNAQIVTWIERGIAQDTDPAPERTP